MEILLERVIIGIVISFLLTAIFFLFSRMRSSSYFESYLRFRYMPSFEKIKKTYAHANPGCSWYETDIKLNQNIEKIAYPYWDCWVLFKDLKLLDAFGYLFLGRFGMLLSANTKICAVTKPSLFLLGKIETYLRNQGIEIFPFDKNFSIPDEWINSQLILFDINYNSGKTMDEAIDYYKNIKWQPSYILVIFFNDLMPVYNNKLSKTYGEDIFKYVYNATDISKLWDDQTVTKNLEIIKEAFAEQRSWSDQSVRKAIIELQMYAKSKGSSS